MFKDKAFLFILFLALILRLFFVFVFPQIPVANDASAYDILGWNFSQGKGFVAGDNAVEAIVGPGYPFFLSIIYKIFGHSYNSVKFFQVLINMVTIFLMYSIAGIVFNKKVALISFFIGAVYLPFLTYNALLLTESLFTFFIVFFIYLTLLNIKKESSWIAFLAGLIAGCAVLTREEFILFLPAIFLFGFLYSRKNKKNAIILILISLVVILPWTFRNYKVFHKFLLVSSQAGRTFWVSTYKDEWLEWSEWKREEVDKVRNFDKKINTAEQNYLLIKQSFKNIKERPFLYTEFCFKRFFRFWVGGHSNTVRGLTNSFGYYIRSKEYLKVVAKTFFLLGNLFLVFLGFIGFFLSRKKIPDKHKEVVLLFIPVFIITVIHFFLFATTRYQVPIMPFMLIFAAYAIEHYYTVSRYHWCILKKI